LRTFSRPRPRSLPRAISGSPARSASACRGISESSKDASKLNEYRDLNDDGVISEIDVKGRGGKYHLDVFGENLGLDDQYIDLKGGQYGVFSTACTTTSCATT